MVGFFALTAKILCLLVLLGGVGLLGCAGYRFTVQSGHFTLKQLIILGVSDEFAAELRILALPDPAKKPNLLFIKADRIKETLLKHRSIESVSVTKRYPNTLIIRARERTPCAVVACGTLYLIDKDGYVLEDVDRLEGDQLRFPFITGVKVGEIDLGQPIRTKGVLTALDLYRCVEQTSPRMARQLSEIRVERDESLTAILAGGVEVRMGKHDFSERLAALELFVKRFGQMDRFEYLDLRFDDQIVYRERNG